MVPAKATPMISLWSAFLLAMIYFLSYALQPPQRQWHRISLALVACPAPMNTMLALLHALSDLKS
jgi:hypothetical protein